MLTVSLGPLHITVEQLMLIAAFVVALLFGTLSNRNKQRPTPPIAGTLLDIALVGLVAARIGFVVLYFEHYRDSLIGLIDIRDGGFHIPTGLIVALAFTIYLGWRRVTIRKPLGVAVAVGVITWGVAASLTHLVGTLTQDVPDVALTTLQDEPVNIKAVGHGQPRVVNLWASWCPPCVREMPVLQSAQEQYADVAFIFVNQQEAPATVREFLDKHDLALDNVLLDDRGAFPQAIGSRGLPVTLYYDASGRMVDLHMGELSEATLMRGLDRFAPRYLKPHPQ